MERTSSTEDSTFSSKHIFYISKGNLNKNIINILFFISSKIEPKKRKSEKNEFICPLKECGKIYYLKNKLITHLRTHYGIKPYKCKFCYKAFNEKGNLKTHLRIHTGERPYKCKRCNKGFKALGQLKDHIISHTIYKPFQCPYCKKYYRRKGILKNHMLIHLKDPFYLNSEHITEEDLNKIKVMPSMDNSWTKRYMIYEKNGEYNKTIADKEIRKNKIKDKILRKKPGHKKNARKNYMFKIEHHLIYKKRETEKNKELKNKNSRVPKFNTELKFINVNSDVSNGNNITNSNLYKTDNDNNRNTGNDFNNNFNSSFKNSLNCNFINNFNNQIIYNHLDNIFKFNLFDDNNLINNDDLYLYKEERENEYLAHIDTLMKDKFNDFPNDLINNNENSVYFNENEFDNPLFQENNEVKEYIESIFNNFND